MANDTARDLLHEAAALFDAPHTRLQASAQKAWRGGFESGGEWMRECLWIIRNGNLPYRAINFSALGLLKYGAAISAAALFAGLVTFFHHYWLLPLAIGIFYLVEAQFVFLFPLAIDGIDDLFSHSRLLVQRAGGTWRILCKVLSIAATMIFGGIFGGGFVRSWCLGCLAVVVWYERLRVSGNAANKVQTRKLEIANSLPLQVRTERFSFLENQKSIRVIYASDLHLEASSDRVANQLVEAIRMTTPDLVLLGGDLVDSRHGLPLLRQAVLQIREIVPQVWAIPGNHDEFVGEVLVRNAVEESGANWLGKQSVLLQLPGRNPLQLDGAAQNVSAAHGRILCAHDPAVFPDAARVGYSLVLAGHLHGGQCVLRESSGKLYPGAFFYQWNGLRFEQDGSIMLVSRGVSDTVPIRWNCPREILLCEIF